MPTLNQIGTETFITLSQPPESLRQMVEVEGRSGIDGVNIYLTGTRGQQFVVQSSVDLDTLLLAYAKQRTYEAMVGANPVGITWGSLAVPTVTVVVVNVRTLSLQRVAGALGGLTAGIYLLRTEWTLQPVT